MQRIFKVRIKAIELGLLSVWWAWSTSRPIKLCLFSQWCNQHLIVKIFSWIKYVILGKHIICDPMDCSPPGSSVHVIQKARILEWVTIHFSRVSSWSKGSNQGLLHYRQIPYCLSLEGSPKYICICSNCKFLFHYQR